MFDIFTFLIEFDNETLGAIYFCHYYKKIAPLPIMSSGVLLFRLLKYIYWYFQEITSLAPLTGKVQHIIIIWKVYSFIQYYSINRGKGKNIFLTTKEKLKYFYFFCYTKRYNRSSRIVLEKRWGSRKITKRNGRGDSDKR